MSDKPHMHWDKMVSAAYLRMLDHTQEEAAEAVHRSPRTIREWESDPRWELARQEAQDRWLSGLRRTCRQTILDGCGDDPKLALEVYRSLETDLAKPATRHELEHSGAVSHEHDIPRENRIAALRALNAGAPGARGNGTGDAG